MKKYILLCLLFNCYAINFGMHKIDLYAIEAAIRGKIFYIKPDDFLYNSVWHNIITDIRNGIGVQTYYYSSVQAQSTEKNKELWPDEIDTYYKLIENALSRVNNRRDALKKEVDDIITFDACLMGWSFGQYFFDMLNKLRIFFRYTSHCNTIDAYNHLTVMKNRLEKLVADRMEKFKREEVALVFKKQNIYLNGEMQNEDIPKEVVQKNILPFLLKDGVTTSARDIALLGYWSDGVGGCSESNPPYMSINIGFKSLPLHGEISSVLYDVSTNCV
jgi:hypothetical protein